MNQKLNYIYTFNYITNVLINFDHGIIPACTTEMKRDLNIDDIEIGLLGSSVYAGLVIGSGLGTQLFSKFKTKNIVIGSVGCGIISLSIFLITRNIYLLFLSRFLVGFFQVYLIQLLIFLVVFFPVWIDFYGENKKTLWLTFMQLGVALGAVIGYLVTSLFIEHTKNWYYPYYLQIGFLIPCLLFYAFFCDYSDLDTQGLTETEQEIKSDSPDMKSNLSNLVSNQLFIFTMLALSSLFFVVTGIQFWITDYMRIILHQPHQFVFKAFIIISLTAPILGVFCGGLLLHIMGGYDGVYALKIVAVEAFLASLAALPIPYRNNIAEVLSLLWLLLFFGGSAVPAITGIMISSIPKEQRSSGNSISHLFQELLGYLPAPTLYGYVQKMSGGPESRNGMILLTCWSMFGLLFILLSLRVERPIYSQNSMEMVEVEILQQEEEEKKKQKVDFNYIKRQTSLSEARSSYKRSDSLESPLYKRMNPRSSRKSREQSISEVMFNFASIIGRGSIEPHMIKEHKVDIHIPPQRMYLISEGRYLND